MKVWIGWTASDRFLLGPPHLLICYLFVVLLSLGARGVRIGVVLIDKLGKCCQGHLCITWPWLSPQAQGTATNGAMEPELRLASASFRFGRASPSPVKTPAGPGWPIVLAVAASPQVKREVFGRCRCAKREGRSPMQAAAAGPRSVPSQAGCFCFALEKQFARHPPFWAS